MQHLFHVVVVREEDGWAARCDDEAHTPVRAGGRQVRTPGQWTDPETLHRGVQPTSKCTHYCKVHIARNIWKNIQIGKKVIHKKWLSETHNEHSGELENNRVKFCILKTYKLDCRQINADSQINVQIPNYQYFHTRQEQEMRQLTYIVSKCILIS